MKKKKLLSLLLSIAVTFSVAVPAFSVPAFAADSIGVDINGVPVQFTESSGNVFIDSQNRTQVPLRATMEAYGCDVQWDASTRTGIVSKGGKTVTVPIGQKYITLNGNRIENDTAAVIQNNRTYLPIRAVVEAFGGYVDYDSATRTVEIDSQHPLLKVHFIDVGQADAALIDIGEVEVLIDAGNNSDGSTVVNYIRPYVDGELDLVIETHPDADHIGGMDDVLAAYEVGGAIISGDTSDTATFRDFYNALQNEPDCIYAEDADATIPLGYYDAYLNIVETGDNYSDSNDNSVVVELVYNNVKTLFTGDMSSDVENSNLSKFEDVDVLKVGHHGSAYSTSTAFLNVVKPEFAIISAGTGNNYGHPAASTLQRLFNINAKVLGTFKSETISLSTNGIDYNLNKSDYLTLSDAGAGGTQVPDEPSTPTTPTTPTNPTTPDPQPSDPVTYQYVGNKNSKVFHKSTCSSVDRMKESNKVKFGSASAALQAGYTPCKVCNPA